MIAKTQETLELENAIYKATKKQGIFGCFEVTIGWFGKERVDYITYDTNGFWRCYEIKVSKSDFNSKAAHTFVGHFNYYVLTKELYEQVKNEIPTHIGVYIGGVLMKRPKKQQLGVNEQILKNSMIRSLSREFDKSINSESIEYVQSLKSDINKLERQKREEQRRYNELYKTVYEKLGRAWMRENL